MDEKVITAALISGFEAYLRREERAEQTVGKYSHDLQAFSKWLGGRTVTKEAVTAWKNTLCAAGRAAVTVNSNLAALHSFFAWMGWEGCRVKYLKIQRRMFRDSSRDMDRSAYVQMIRTARKCKKTCLALLMETIGSTGIRVSEVKYITVEAARRGRTDIALKGKIRTILIPGSLARKLLQYAQKQKIAWGEIFLTTSGKGISRGQIWSEMKRLSKSAGVDASKVFPHNLRHLFARTFYQANRDIVRLADVLGHSSIETTRIYLITTGREYARQLEQLGLVL